MVRKKTGGTLSLSPALLVAGNIDFLPLMWDSGFKVWHAKGLSTISLLFDDDGLKPCEQLQNQFGLPKTDLFNCLQQPCQQQLVAGI